MNEFISDPEKMKLFDLHGFLARNSKDIRRPEIFACAKILRSEYQKVGAIGYCYGGWGCVELAAKGNDIVDCITLAHPTFVLTSDIDNLAVPTQIIAPEVDNQLTPELKEYCNKVIPTLGIQYRYDYYPGLRHGFASRGDPTNATQKDGLERAKNAAVSWFNEFLH